MTAVDLLPEFVHWKDDGCSLCPSCLKCSLPVCRYDMPYGKAASVLITEREVMGLIAGGLTPDEAALRMGISRRSVFRHQRRANQRQAGE